MKTDQEIKEAILAELMWQQNINDTNIGVIVEDGVATLSGVVDSFAKKLAAEKVAKSTKGVKATALDIEVKLGDNYKKTDKEIAKAAVNALSWDNAVPEENLFVKVEDGQIYLSGEVDWFYQKEAAKNAVENLMGVKDVINTIDVKHSEDSNETIEKITKAFERLANIDSKNIAISVDGHTVTLSGSVRTISEKDEAQKAAYFTPGVKEVKNELQVNYHPIFFK
jgi:osmotically-inducible protein OsmY